MFFIVQSSKPPTLNIRRNPNGGFVLSLRCIRVAPFFIRYSTPSNIKMKILLPRRVFLQIAVQQNS